MERLMQANNPAHLDFVKVHVYTTVPMKPRTAQKTPKEDIIWISNVKILGSPLNILYAGFKNGVSILKG